jgi:hypothetical protein
MSNSQRKKLIAGLLDYYTLHNALAGEITSHLVLEQL